jgi:serralysin
MNDQPRFIELENLSANQPNPTVEDSDGDGSLDKTTTLSYDEAGNLISSREVFDYDLNGQPDTIYATTYNAAGDIVSSHLDFDGDSIVDQGSENTYDAEGDLTRSFSYQDTNDDGVSDYTVDRFYDKFGNLTSASYDENGDGKIDIRSVTTYDTGRPRTTTSYFDELGQVNKELAFNGDGSIDTITTFTYDAAGSRLSASIDRRGDGTIDEIINYSAAGNPGAEGGLYTYDEMGNLTISYRLGGESGAQNIFAYTFNSAGQQTKATIDYGADGSIDSEERFAVEALASEALASEALASSMALGAGDRLSTSALLDETFSESNPLLAAVSPTAVSPIQEIF